jgi:hypothetical protein
MTFDKQQKIILLIEILVTIFSVSPVYDSATPQIEFSSQKERRLCIEESQAG